VAALLSVYQPPHHIWEPACGDGAIVKALRTASYEVVATDLNDWGCPESSARIDLLMERTAPPHCHCIITNPPYRLAEPFIAHALQLVPEVAMLCRLAFLESTRRTRLLEESGLARVLVFRNRLPMMHRYGYSSSTAFAWYIWQRGYNDMPRLERISCSRFLQEAAE
jgi:methylase of polypeptide subunit release factors